MDEAADRRIGEDMLKRKLNEIGSNLYRSLVYPFVRMRLERKSKSILKQGSYLYGGSTLSGRNFVGRDSQLCNVSLGYCSYLNKNCDLANTEIGRYTSIGNGVTTVLGKHPTDTFVSTHPAFYSASALGYSYVTEDRFVEMTYLDEASRIQVRIGNDVWIGSNVQIMEGVTIADGCVVAAGAVVTKDTEAYGIYAGVPARLIRKRFDDETIEKLLHLQWWKKDENWIREHVEQFKDCQELLREVDG